MESRRCGRANVGAANPRHRRDEEAIYGARKQSQHGSVGGIKDVGGRMPAVGRL